MKLIRLILFAVVCLSSICQAQDDLLKNWLPLNCRKPNLPVSNDLPGFIGEYAAGSNVFSATLDPKSNSVIVSTQTPTGNLLGSARCPNPVGSGSQSCTGTTTQTSGTALTTTVTFNGSTIATIDLTTGSIHLGGAVTQQISQAPSTAGAQACTTDPISTATGGLDAGPFLDLSLGGPLPLVLRRFYSSGLGANFGQNAIGYNWTTNFDPYVGISGNAAVVALEGAGTVSFQTSGATYKTVYAPRLAYQFVKTATVYRFLNPENNLIYNFDSNGFLTKIEDRNGNALTITRGLLGVTQVADGLGRSLTFSYAGTGARPALSSVADQTGRSVSYALDANYNLISVMDANGNKTTYSYSGTTSLLAKTVRPRGNTPYTQAFDPTTGAAITQTDSGGNTTKLAFVTGAKPGVTTLTDPLGRKTTFNYGDASLVNLTSVVDVAGNTSVFTYDAAARPTSFTDRLGNKGSITYDAASGYPATFTDAQGNTTTWTYQPQVQGDFTFYNLAKITYADGTSKTFTYDGSGNVLTAADGAGKKTTYTYNSRGQVLTETNPAGGVTTTTYNTDGTIATVKIPSGDVTTYTYDNLKRLAKIQYADSTSRAFTRDALNHILSVTDERGKVSKIAYDANNNVQSTTDALSKTDAATYDTDDLLSTSTDRLGNETQYQYDALGSATSVTNAAGEQTTFSYDNLERLQSVTDPLGLSSSFVYDAEGRLASVTNAVGNTAKVQADKNGRPAQLTSPLGANTNIAYDAMGRITGVTDALGRQSSMTYEGRGLPSGVTAPGGITVSFAWGELPLLNSVTDPNGNVWPITRDTLGRVTASTDPLGRANKYTYDSRSRVASFTSPADSAQLTYDAAGNVTQAQYSDGTTLSYTYDDNNRRTGGTGFAVSYDANGRIVGSNGLTITRDAVGRISTITYAAGKTVTYSYDSRGLLSRIADWSGGGAVFSFDNAHRLIGVRRSNGVITSYTYDKDSRIIAISESEGLVSIGQITFQRDAIGRVTSATRNVPQEARPTAGTSPFSFDAANQIAGGTYDARGRLTNDNAGATYRWSAASRLTSYARKDGSASATYDGMGQRISRTGADGTTRNFVINYATRLPSIPIIRSGTSDLRYYVYTPEGLLLYSIEGGSATRRYYSFDETGSTTFLTDDQGNISDIYGISPYGEIVTAGPTNSAENPFTWQGQFGVMQEPGTKLYYARFRYYDAPTGRFLSRDPLFSPAPKEVNPYQYAAGNPVANGDPTGLKTSTAPMLVDKSYEPPVNPPRSPIFIGPVLFDSPPSLSLGFDSIDLSPIDFPLLGSPGIVPAKAKDEPSTGETPSHVGNKGEWMEILCHAVACRSGGDSSRWND